MSQPSHTERSAGPLTRKQAAVMDLFQQDHGEVNEGTVANECWPLIRGAGVRLVCNALEKKGLIRMTAWEDDGTGYMLVPTDAGRAHFAAGQAEEGSNA